MSRAAVIFERPVSAKANPTRVIRPVLQSAKLNPKVCSVEFTNIRLCGYIFQRTIFKSHLMAQNFIDFCQFLFHLLLPEVFFHFQLKCTNGTLQGNHRQ